MFLLSVRPSLQEEKLLKNKRFRKNIQFSTKIELKRRNINQL